ncbi:MAG: hypothetical protein F6K63_33005 [Moorea sp. SIO1G6]|uniref:hypothetical protein n=1 Tax=Moorena sp. SIO1G6 TaxID=2607840 RepID=UPI0013C131EB|nr:hypothetical protein [Moorena sp. SIO1G6]NET68958.1 hypothetical protein [Moorena sp. SIO1G6]
MSLEWASWWNGHLGGMGILVEWASWWNGHLGGMGILVEWASWWNGHLARYNRLSGGHPAHSTAIHSFPDSRFPIPHSRFPTPQNHKTPQRHNLAGLHDILFGGGRRI